MTPIAALPCEFRDSVHVVCVVSTVCVVCRVCVEFHGTVAVHVSLRRAACPPFVSFRPLSSASFSTEQSPVVSFASPSIRPKQEHHVVANNPELAGSDKPRMVVLHSSYQTRSYALLLRECRQGLNPSSDGPARACGGVYKMPPLAPLLPSCPDNFYRKEQNGGVKERT